MTWTLSPLMQRVLILVMHILTLTTYLFVLQNSSRYYANIYIYNDMYANIITGVIRFTSQQTDRIHHVCIARECDSIHACIYTKCSTLNTRGKICMSRDIGRDTEVMHIHPPPLHSPTTPSPSLIVALHTVFYIPRSMCGNIINSRLLF